MWSSTSTSFMYPVRSRYLHCALSEIMACRQTLYMQFSDHNRRQIIVRVTYMMETHLAADRDRLEVFLRRSTALGFRPLAGTICSDVDDILFAAITLNVSSSSSCGGDQG